jgi:hypothetical protein
VEQRRASQKAAMQIQDALPDFDLSDVLAKAQTLVPPQSVSDAEEEATAPSPSDSFDDNTFYSSQHDTPDRSKSRSVHSFTEAGELHTLSVPSHIDSANAPRVPASASKAVDIAEQIPMSTIVPGLQELARPNPMHSLQASQPASIATTNASHKVAGAAAKREISNVRPNAASGVARPQSSHISTGQGPLSTGEKSAPKAVAQQVTPVRETHKRKLSIEEPNVVRNFNLSPVAPQPARVSPLAVARAPAIVQDSFGPHVDPPLIPSATEHLILSGVSSSGRNSQNLREPGKQLGNVNGSPKAAPPNDAIVANSPPIKAEPRSPSPLTAQPLLRPRKRQRQLGPQAGGLDYDEPQYDDVAPTSRPAAPHQQTGQRSRRQQKRRHHATGEEPHEVIEIDNPQPGEAQRSRDDRFVGQPTQSSRHNSLAHQAPYLEYDARQNHATARISIEADNEVPTRRYVNSLARKPREAIIIDDETGYPTHGRQSIVPMAPPPRSGLVRVVVDEYGREHHVPVRGAQRQSLAPMPRLHPQDYLYEQPPTRIISRPLHSAYEEDDIVYRVASPAYAPQRRVVTLPEQAFEESLMRPRQASVRPSQTMVQDSRYAPLEGSGQIQREYSVRPVAVGSRNEDYRVSREPVLRRQIPNVEEHTLEPLQRVPSVRPDRVRYTSILDYGHRPQTVRPEDSAVQFGASGAAPQAYVPWQHQATREYSVQPADAGVVRRRFVVPQDEPYEVVRYVSNRVPDEGDYVVASRGLQQRTYADLQ